MGMRRGTSLGHKLRTASCASEHGRRLDQPGVLRLGLERDRMVLIKATLPPLPLTTLTQTCAAAAQAQAEFPRALACHSST